jgi:DNA-binding GntR family transcriptional regulator
MSPNDWGYPGCLSGKLFRYWRGMASCCGRSKAIVQGLTDEEIIDQYDIRAMLEAEAAVRASMKKKNLQDIILAQEEVEKTVADLIDKSIMEHRDIVSAIASGNSDDARSTMVAHIKRSLKDFLDHRKQMGQSDAQV